jgi:hypothetical protein
MEYRILCTVSGGVTGTRQRYLKKMGKEYRTENKEEAEIEAATLNAGMNHDYSPAKFSYEVKEVTNDPLHNC